MSHSSFYKLLKIISVLIEKQNSVMRQSITASARLLVTLRFLATGEKFWQLAYGFPISYSVISLIVPETLKAIYFVLKDDYLKVPHSASEWEEIADEFEQKWNFLHCLFYFCAHLFCVLIFFYIKDGKHIAISSQNGYGSQYYNYKCFNSVILSAVVDADYRFIYVNIDTNGRANDAADFHESSLYEGIKHNLFDFPTDSGLTGFMEG